MNTNHTTTNNANNNTNNNTNNKGEKSMHKETLSKKKTSLLYIIALLSVMLLCVFLSKPAGMFVIASLAAAGVLHTAYYLAETKRNGAKRNFFGFFESIYTQEDFENFSQGLSEELYKEIKNDSYVEISTEKQELEKERAKMKAFLRKHNTAGVVFDDFEEKIMVDVGLCLGECFSEDFLFYNTLQDFVKFFDQNKEGFISEIYNTDCIFNEMIEGLAYYCLNKTTQKELRDLRKRIHKAYCKDGYEEIGIYDYGQEQQELAGENEATFRC